MREKLLDLMKNEGLKPSQLAEMLGINPAGISHILAGRNKPGFDLLQKILRRFPKINPDWLLLDSNQMYRDPSNVTTQSAPIVKNDLFASSQQIHEKISDAADSSITTSPQDPSEISEEFSKEKTDTTRIERIVVFYSDRTFRDYHPKK